MSWLTVLEWVLGSRRAHERGGTDITPMEKAQQLQSASAALWSQAELLQRLVCVEWAEEKLRWRRMLLLGVMGFAFLLCALVFVGVLVMALSWDTPWRIHAAAVLLAAYACIAALLWRGLKNQQARGEQAFAATREELTTDLALLKQRVVPNA